MLILVNDEGPVPYEPIYFGPLQRFDDEWLWCDECRFWTPHRNNSACGDPECCGPNRDYCLLCYTEC